mmetsp:Transcript_14686/g.43640  ORF Transcript_14686/g.43640 Transcript_14686/m.43640 type:complete len:207 (-) Transcript_14686:52-672(-)|eukprot:CAMPEP_0198543480 /NCGR_PEP_ID=MMETSP1462-20131121/59689_1 /TAXON_ID=1333877 /ORGANISM="Brandtodinium nutriculum, Strain RCC3387" /LENGTH=206 /DNA_ID=CAMNT_0044273763 /DNA_START=73 /DNA_END=693 /DNA_ORIENTATION=+
MSPSIAQVGGGGRAVKVMIMFGIISERGIPAMRLGAGHVQGLRLDDAVQVSSQGTQSMLLHAGAGAGVGRAGAKLQTAAGPAASVQRPVDGQSSEGTHLHSDCGHQDWPSLLFQIFVRCAPGEILTLCVGPFDVVEHIKTMIQDKTDTPKDRLRLTYGGSILRDDLRLSHYNIFGGATLFFDRRIAPMASLPDAPADLPIHEEKQV